MEVVSGGVSGDRVLARPLFLHHLDGMNLGKSTICGHFIAVTVTPSACRAFTWWLSYLVLCFIPAALHIWSVKPHHH